MNSKNKEIIVMGFGLFAMFLGAGNIIFPPYIGIVSGQKWPAGLLGFAVTGIGMPLLGLLATFRAGGNIDKFAGKVSLPFAKAFNFAILLCIGPLFAIPRTAATTFEVGILPLLGAFDPGSILGISWSAIAVSFIFFAVTLYFSLNPSQVLDQIGTYFTPFLILMLGFIIVKGILVPIGKPAAPVVDNAFALGFTEGYQTMDALASMAFASIIMADIMGHGHGNTKEGLSMAVKVALVSMLGFLFVYGGLVYLGASGGESFANTKDGHTAITVRLVDAIAGDTGRYALASAMTFACLTTAIGLTTAVAGYFEKLLDKRLSYRGLVWIIVTASAVLSVYGVRHIISLSVPVLYALYPVAIVLILLNLFDRESPPGVYRGAVVGAFLIGILYGLQHVSTVADQAKNMLAAIPLGQEGFAWIFTSALGGIAGAAWTRRRRKNAAPEK
ncbi:branched-chain amino acid transport system II carrier protein [Pyramidobacter sp. C12-8]|uniref:branched-chain amino acid transport system II carrier protein n=1 Tax=Pyramidobacter sp. C12-8 TaxID=1943580 RepID=UPI00098F6669|nr:branched-chain amino acid transport system II carrier protein [Pyramidobacter sp. C12-8]OON86910.1 branched-chain amino acid transport system II carrier protein [Pyramidobacter sp. C12-8]